MATQRFLCVVLISCVPFRVVHCPSLRSFPWEPRSSRVSQNAYKPRRTRLTSGPWPSRPPHARAGRHRVAEPGGGGAPRARRHASCRFRSPTAPTRRSCTRPRAPGRRSSSSQAISTPFPAQDNLPGRIEDGWVDRPRRERHEGRRRRDDRAGRWAAAGSPLRSTSAFLFFVREELPADESALPRVFAEAPLVLESDLVVVLEPTDNAIHAGCLGNLNATLIVPRRERPLGAALAGCERDRRSPWRASAPVVAVPPLEVEVGGLTFVEVLSATRIQGGIADNVIPDRVEVAAQLPLRAEPDARGGRGAAARAGRRRARDHVELAARRGSRPTRRSSSGSAQAGELARRAEAGVDAGRRVRRRRASTRSTSAPARRATRTGATSGSRSPSSSGRSRRCARFASS